MTYLLHFNIRISSTSSASICILVHSFAYDVMHIDPTNEELTPEQPLIEEPEDEQEDPQPTTDHITEEAPSNPSGEDSLAALALDPMNRVRRTRSTFFSTIPSTGGKSCFEEKMARTKQTARKATGARITVLPDVTHTPPVVEDGLLHTRCKEECPLSQLLCRALREMGRREEEAYRKAIMAALTSLSFGWEAGHTVLRYLPTNDLDHTWLDRREQLQDRNGSRPLVVCMDYAREARGMYHRAEDRSRFYFDRYTETHTRVEELKAQVAQLQPRLAEYEPPQQPPLAPTPLEEESSEPMEMEEEEENVPSDANSRV
ncbi:hypothetical protein U9M48_019221 [Paspalum notatum var. saurae]|uniref:Uncharacterized protein n=1 Tax=Paspalum notatum var. saurae TaxID=547442 RepID=A0AAQ3TF74_PASNO